MIDLEPGLRVTVRSTLPVTADKEPTSMPRSRASHLPRTSPLAALALLAAGWATQPVAAQEAVERVRIEVGDLVFDALAAGPGEGETVLLLHGFPQTSHSWRGVVAELGRRGFRAVAPDQRGYSADARPSEDGAYRMGALADDVLGIADALGARRFHLAGHDWGGAVAWAVAAWHPSRVRSLTVLSTPHPVAFGRAAADPEGDQAQRSSYMARFAAPDAADGFLADGAAGLRAVLSSPPIPAADVEEYVRFFSQGETLHAALAWYRALRGGGGGGANRAWNPIAAPTLYVWGRDDPVFSPAAVEATAALVSGPYEHHALEVGHWILEGEPEHFLGLFAAHLEGATGGSSSTPRVTTLELDSELPSVGRIGGLAVGPDGDLYVANFSASVWRIGLDGAVERLEVSLQGSSGTAVDADGNVFQGSFVDDRIVRIGPEGKAETWVDEGLQGPVGIAVGDEGDLFVCNCKGKNVARVGADRSVSVFATSPDFECPNGIVRDDDGSLIVVSYGNGFVVAVAPDGSTRRLADLPEGGNAHVAIDDEAIYVTKIAANRIYRVARDGAFEPFAGSGALGLDDGPLLEATLARPNGIALSADGRALWVNNLDGPWKTDQPTRLVLRRIDLPD